MSKYMPLWNYIAENNSERLTFEEIKVILGFEIDHSFLNFKKELNEFGFKIDKISTKEKVVFIKRLNKISN